MKALWDQQPPDIKQIFGEKYYKIMIKMMNPAKADKMASTPKQVVDEYVHAGLSNRPRRRYLIGYDACMLAYTIGLLPTCVGDYIQGKLRKPVVPDGAMRRNSKVTWC